MAFPLRSAAPLRLVGLLLGLVLSGGLMACTELERASCVDNRQCQSAAGLGATCQDDGFCAPAAPPAGCTNTFPRDEWGSAVSGQEPLPIGVIYTSEHTRLVDAVNAALVAVRDKNINTAYRLLSVECSLAAGLWPAGAPSTDRAKEAARFLIEEVGAQALLILTGTREAQGVVGLASAYGVAAITPSASGQSLDVHYPTNATNAVPGLLWQTIPQDRELFRHLSDEVARHAHNHQNEAPTVSIIADGSVYMGSGLNLFNELFDGIAQPIAGSEFRFYTCQTADCAGAFASHLDAALAGEPDYLILLTESESHVNAMMQHVDARRKETSSYLGDTFLVLTGAGYGLSSFVGLSDAFNAITHRIIGVRPSADPSAQTYSHFLAALDIVEQGTLGQSSKYMSHAYDAAWFAIIGHVAAAVEAGSNREAITGFAISRGIRRILDAAGSSLTNPGSLANWNSLVSGFRDPSNTWKFLGASGPLDYDLGTQTPTGYHYALWSLESRNGTGCVAGVSGCGNPGVFCFCPVDDVLCTSTQNEPCGEWIVHEPEEGDGEDQGGEPPEGPDAPEVP